MGCGTVYGEARRLGLLRREDAATRVHVRLTLAGHLHNGRKADFACLCKHFFEKKYLKTHGKREGENGGRAILGGRGAGGTLSRLLYSTACA